MIQIEFTLPWGPSVNGYWRTPSKGPLAGRKVLTKKAYAYKKAVAAAVLEQRVPRQRLAGSLELAIVAVEPNKIRRDIGNLIKIVEDSLVAAEVIEDDFHIDRLSIERGGYVKDGQLRVTIRQLATRVEQSEIPLQLVG